MTNDTISGLMGPGIRSVSQLLYQGQNNNSPPDLYYFVMNFHVDHTFPPQIIKTCPPSIRTIQNMCTSFSWLVPDCLFLAFKCSRLQRALQRWKLERRGIGVVPLATQGVNGNNTAKALWEQFGIYIRQNNFLTGGEIP